MKNTLKQEIKSILDTYKTRIKVCKGVLKTAKDNDDLTTALVYKERIIEFENFINELQDALANH